MTRRPMFGSLAARLHRMRSEGRTREAEALLAAHNRISEVFGDGQPYDEAADWTDQPLDGLVTAPAKGGPRHGQS